MNEKEYILSKMRIIPDFPKEGIGFLDICPVIGDPKAFGMVIDLMEKECRGKGYTKIAGLESRGFVFGAPLAHRLGVSFVMARKAGKLPGECVAVEYDTEYSTARIELQKDALVPEDKVLIVDDIIATGGSLAAVSSLAAGICGSADSLVFIDITDIPKTAEVKYSAILEMKEKQ